MDVQKCYTGAVASDAWHADFPSAMLQASIEFQQSLTAYSSNPRFFCRSHMIEMGIQEASEAWDLLEGGWKHHKTNPKPTDWSELLMECVDVAVYLSNACFYADKSDGLDAFSTSNWSRIASCASNYRGVPLAPSIVYFGRGAHGDDNTKECALRISEVRFYLFKVMCGSDKTFTRYVRSASESLVRAVCAAGYSQADFINAYASKMRTNHVRQAGGY